MSSSPFSFPLALISLISLASFSAAQGQTWVVDVLGGPRVFTDIQSAVDAAATTGDTILVRKGDYSGFRIISKAVTILADDGGRVATGPMQSLIIYSAPLGGRTIIRGLQFATTMPSMMVVVGNQGTLILDGVVMAGGMTFCDFTNANLVHIERCAMQGTMMFQGNTAAVIVDSVCRGVTRPLNTAGKQSPTILANLSQGWEIHIGASTIVGAAAVSVQDLPGAAIEFNSQSRIVIRGSAADLVAAGRGVLPRSAIVGAVAGQAELILDSRVPVLGNGMAPGVDWPGTVTHHTDATVTSTAGAVGSGLVVQVRAEQAAVHLLLAGVPVQPFDASPFGVLALGSFMVVTGGGGGTAQHRFAIPNDQKLRGIVVGWQVVGSLPNQFPRLGNASMTTIR